MFCLFAVSIHREIGIAPYLPYLSQENFTQFLEGNERTVVFFGEDFNELDFAFFGVNKNKQHIAFALAGSKLSEEYHCSSFPCVVPFQRGGRMIIDKAPKTAVSFTRWLESVKGTVNREISTYEELRLLFDGTRPVIMAVDAEKPSNYPEDSPIYFVKRELISEFGINIANGVYCYHPIFRTIEPVNDANSCLHQSVIHPQGVRITERQFLAGYVLDHDNTTMNDMIFENIKEIAELPEFKDFWFTAIHGGASSAAILDAGQFGKGIPPFFFVLNTSDLKFTRNRWCLTKNNEKFDVPLVKSFLTNISKGTQPYSLLSAPIPKQDPYMPNLIRVVSDNIEDVVLQQGTDVLLAITASWCAHCHALLPTLSQAANLVAERAKIVVVDADSNELPDFVPYYSGYPTLFFFGATNKTAIPFNGQRDLDGILLFLSQNCADKFDPDSI